MTQQILDRLDILGSLSDHWCALSCPSLGISLVSYNDTVECSGIYSVKEANETLMGSSLTNAGADSEGGTQAYMALSTSCVTVHSVYSVSLCEVYSLCKNFSYGLYKTLSRSPLLTHFTWLGRKQEIRICLSLGCDWHNSCNPSIWETETEKSLSLWSTWPTEQIKDSQGYPEIPCLEKLKNK